MQRVPALLTEQKESNAGYQANSRQCTLASHACALLTSSLMHSGGRVSAVIADQKKSNTHCRAEPDGATLFSPAGALLISPDDLRAQLGVIASSRCMVVLLVDLLDASGSFLVKARDIAGNNPIVLVGTKVGCWQRLTLLEILCRLARSCCCGWCTG